VEISSVIFLVFGLFIGVEEAIDLLEAPYWGGLGLRPMGPIGDGVGLPWDWGAKAILGSDFHFGQGLFKPKQHSLSYPLFKDRIK